MQILGSRFGIHLYFVLSNHLLTNTPGTSSTGFALELTLDKFHTFLMNIPVNKLGHYQPKRRKYPNSI